MEDTNERRDDPLGNRGRRRTDRWYASIPFAAIGLKSVALLLTFALPFVFFWAEVTGRWKLDAEWVSLYSVGILGFTAIVFKLQLPWQVNLRPSFAEPWDGHERRRIPRHYARYENDPTDPPVH